MAKALTNVTIYDFVRFIEKGYVVFDEEIQKVGKMEDFFDKGYEIEDKSGSIIIPGLVCGHTHIYSAFARGWPNETAIENFTDILEQQWWRLDAALEEEAIHLSGIVSASDHVKNGITTIIDHHASGEIEGSLKRLKKAVCDDIGLRGMFCFETSDRFDVEKAIRENKDFLAEEKNGSFAAHFGLHASLSLSEKTLKKAKAALGDAPIHIHAAESALDQEDCEEKYGERVLERLERHGLLNEGSILVHALHINEKEADIIKRNNCLVALNPSSNMNNAVGIPDYKLFKRKGIPVIIGNDGLSMSITNELQTLMYATHVKHEDFNAFGLDDVWAIIKTAYDYASRRLGVKLGRIEEGHKADLLVIPYTPPTPMDEENALGHLFFGLFSSFRPQDVYVGGKGIVKDHEIHTEAKKLYARAKRSAQKIWENTKERGG